MALEKMQIIPEKGEKVTALYNPNEFTIETRNQFQRTAMPGLATPITQFVSGETQKISLSLFFDTYEEGKDVREMTGKVVALAKIDKSLHTPPVCNFVWGGAAMSGDRATFRGVIDSISQKFTMFLNTGIPVRATLTVSISEYKTYDEQIKELGLQSADLTKNRVFLEGETLWQIADEMYKDPGKWRVIAEANNISNPRLIEPGTELTIPSLE